MFFVAACVGLIREGWREFKAWRTRWFERPQEERSPWADRAIIGAELAMRTATWSSLALGVAFGVWFVWLSYQ